MNGASLSDPIARQRALNIAAGLVTPDASLPLSAASASLASLSSPTSAASEAHEKHERREKPAKRAKRIVEKTDSPNLVDTGALRASDPASSNGRSLDAILSDHRGSVLLAATLTTRDGDDSSLDIGFASAKTAAGLLGGILHREDRNGSHRHAHGLLLFSDDAAAESFASLFKSAAHGNTHAVKLKPVSSWAAFSRTGELRAPWSERGLDDDLRGILGYAAKSGSAAERFGVFANATLSRPPRLCACGCGQSLESKRGDAECFDGACRRRVSRAADSGTSRPKRGESRPASDNETSPPKRGESTDDENAVWIDLDDE